MGSPRPRTCRLPRGPAPRRGSALLAALLLVAVLGGCSPDGGHGRGGRGVLVIAIDGLRADHVSLRRADGEPAYDRRTTPGLEALAEAGFSFDQCISAAPERIPGHAAILSGADPRVVRRPPVPAGAFLSLPREWALPRDLPYLPRELLAAGFRTAAFIDDPHLDERLGFASGFESFQRFPQRVREGAGYGSAVIAARFLAWLREQERGRDWFAYLSIKDLERAWTSPDPVRDTYFEPRPELAAVPPVSSSRHAYFAIPLDCWGGGLHSLGEYEARYDGALRQVDLVLQRLFRHLRDRGLWERTTVIVVGAYGMGLGEAGLYLTSGSLADVDLHVPLVIKPPASFVGPRGVVSPHLASTIDVAPTLLELVGVEPPAGLHGVSLLASLLPESPPARRFAFASGGVQAGIAVRTLEHAYQLTTPAVATRRDYTVTYTGLRQGIDPRPREHLQRRGPGADPGDLGPGLDDPELASELRAVGEEWYRWLDHARDALHEIPWRRRPIDAELRSELERRGLVAPEARP